MEIDWRRGLGIKNSDSIRPVTIVEAEQAFKRLSEEAKQLDITKEYGMHVVLHTFISAARKELTDV